MRIDNSTSTSKTGRQSNTRRARESGAKFSVDLGKEAAQAGTTTPNAPVTEVDSLLALQAEDDPLYAKRKIVKRADAMLDLLEQMKVDLLTGGLNPARLTQLMRLIQQAKLKGDPELDAIVADIELRARVELAKTGRFPA